MHLNIKRREKKWKESKQKNMEEITVIEDFAL
jgi:hypothetical protein